MLSLLPNTGHRAGAVLRAPTLEGGKRERKREREGRQGVKLTGPHHSKLIYRREEQQIML